MRRSNIPVASRRLGMRYGNQQTSSLPAGPCIAVCQLPLGACGRERGVCQGLVDSDPSRPNGRDADVLVQAMDLCLLLAASRNWTGPGSCLPRSSVSYNFNLLAAFEFRTFVPLFPHKSVLGYAAALAEGRLRAATLQDTFEHSYIHGII
jgi:hypothetical protein